MRSWFVKQPTRFFIVGFIEVLLIVGFLDIYYLGKLGGVLVEAHGLVFDLFIFGIVLTAYDAIRQAEENKKRREAEKQQRIKRYKEELDDYRGWREKEAGYRVAGIIRRLKKEGVEDVVFDRLNLGQCSKEIVEKAVVAKAHIISLEGANLEYANLQNANLKRANLHRTNLKRANLHGADLEYANLLRLRVNEIDWIENLKKWKVKGVDNIESRYYVDKTPLKFDQDTLYKIRERPKKDDDIPKQCKGETIKGTPCKRKSKPGFNKCYQHLNGVWVFFAQKRL